MTEREWEMLRAYIGTLGLTLDQASKACALYLAREVHEPELNMTKAEREQIPLPGFEGDGAGEESTAD